MADKGFDLKVIIPTEDGINISSKSTEDSPYFLLYNLSNRSYQLAGKLKSRDMLIENQGITGALNKIIVQEKIDLLIGNISSQTLNCKFLYADFPEINKILHALIDKIDQKKELLR